MVFVSAYLVGDAVVADIDKDVKISATDRFVNLSLCFSGAEARAFTVNQERILRITGKRNSAATFCQFTTELYQIRIDFFCHFHAARQSGELDRGDRNGIFK